MRHRKTKGRLKTCQIRQIGRGDKLKRDWDDLKIFELPFDLIPCADKGDAWKGQKFSPRVQLVASMAHHIRWSSPAGL